MPELPEVETIKNGLSILKGQSITKLNILSTHCLRPNHNRFHSLRGQVVTNISRRGKLLIIHLSSGNFLIFHLKMTGKLILADFQDLLDKHTHLEFFFKSNRLFFNDVRKFGFVCLFSKKELLEWNFWRTLGPEPFKISSIDFAQQISKSKANIKSLLLNQKIIAGIGNIYADESLFISKIHPLSKANKIPFNILQNLHKNLIFVLKKAISLGGSSFKDYVNSLGKRGNFQDHFFVYSRAGKSCYKCKNTLKKIKVAGRTTIVCLKCQKRYE